MVTQQTANWDQTQAYNVMETILQAHPDIKGVICGNDTMAVGAQAALIASNRSDAHCRRIRRQSRCGCLDRQGSDQGDCSAAHAMLAQQAVDQANKWLKTGSTGMTEKQTVNCILITRKTREN